jgi:hypothetical protein
MPFGLSDAPTAFGDAVAEQMWDLVITEFMELFMDDGGTAADEFGEMLEKLRVIFSYIRAGNLSLSASKTKLFMTETLFTGSTVRPKGVSPDPKKLTTVVRWRQPTTAQSLHSFLGLTQYFRDLIENYASVEGPLRDLLGLVDTTASKSKRTFRQIMRGFQLGPVWTDEHMRCFLRLKRILTSEPVLRSPRFETVDKHPFIVTTDGCQGGFAGTLMQEMEMVLPKGKVVVREHPIAYTSKRTSGAEKRYPPHLLEFAALKFSLDKFANVVRGQPVLVKTDCRALRDVLANDRLNVEHDRWRNGILGYNIVAAKHIKGRNNVAADVLSWKYEDVEEEDGDGHEWSVSPDWEASSGLPNDVFHVSAEEVGELESRDVLLVVALPEGTMALQERLKDEVVYVEVLDALTELDVGVMMRARKRALHKTSEYFVEDGKLWRLGGGAKGRARSRRECVTRAEAVERAAKVHTERGHFGCDAIKMILMDEISSPGLDASILEAIRDCGVQGVRCKTHPRAPRPYNSSPPF